MKDSRFRAEEEVFGRFSLSRLLAVHAVGFECWEAKNRESETMAHLFFLPPEFGFSTAAEQRFREWLSSFVLSRGADVGAATLEPVEYFSGTDAAFELSFPSDASLRSLKEAAMAVAGDGGNSDLPEKVSSALFRRLESLHARDRAQGYFDTGLVFLDQGNRLVLPAPGLVQCVLDELHRIDPEHAFFRDRGGRWQPGTVKGDRVLLDELLADLSWEGKLKAGLDKETVGNGSGRGFGDGPTLIEPKAGRAEPATAAPPDGRRYLIPVVVGILLIGIFALATRKPDRVVEEKTSEKLVEIPSESDTETEKDPSDPPGEVEADPENKTEAMAGTGSQEAENGDSSTPSDTSLAQAPAPEGEVGDAQKSATGSDGYASAPADSSSSSPGAGSDTGLAGVSPPFSPETEVGAGRTDAASPEMASPETGGAAHRTPEHAPGAVASSSSAGAVPEPEEPPAIRSGPNPSIPTVWLDQPRPAASGRVVGYSEAPVTTESWNEIMGGTGTASKGSASRVRLATPEQAREFLETLTARDHREQRLPSDMVYDLPEETQVKSDRLLTKGITSGKAMPFTFVVVAGPEASLSEADAVSGSSPGRGEEGASGGGTQSPAARSGKDAAGRDLPLWERPQ